MAKITIVKPPIVVPVDSIASQAGIPPIGVAYLGSALKRAGHQVQIIDGHGEAIGRHTKIAGADGIVINGLRASEIASRVDEDVDLIAVSCMFSNEWIYVKTIIRTLAAAFPNVPLIVGGEHPTAEPERVLRTVPEIAVCGLGEGEETIVELADHFCNSLNTVPLEQINGVAYLDASGTFVKTAPRSRMRNLDEIAPPAWEELPVRKYHDNGLLLGGGYRQRSMPVIASRGCPYQCTFCTNPLMWEPRWYARSPQAVVDEIKEYIERYGVHHIDFCDLTAIVNKKWTIDFCTLLAKENLGITLAIPVGTRSEALTEEVLRALKSAGITRIQYAPESGSVATLTRIKKAVSLEKMIESMRTSVRLDLITKATMIFGFPDQNLGEVWESIKFIVKLAVIGVHDLPCFHFVPHPGSELYAQLNENGVLDTAAMSEDEYDRFLAGNLCNQYRGMKSYSQSIPDWMLPMLTHGSMMLFYGVQFLIRPHRLVRSAFNLLRGKRETMFELTVYGILKNAFRSRRLRLADVETKIEPARPELLAPAAPAMGGTSAVEP